MWQLLGLAVITLTRRTHSVSAGHKEKVGLVMSVQTPDWRCQRHREYDTRHGYKLVSALLRRLDLPAGRTG